MATTITDFSGYIKVVSGTETNYINKPFDTTQVGSNAIRVNSELDEANINYDDVTSPSSTDIADLISTLMGYNAGAGGDLGSISQNVKSKIDRIKGASDYGTAITYNVTGNLNPVTIVHTGTTDVGVESITETITYDDPTVNGSRVDATQYS